MSEDGEKIEISVAPVKKERPNKKDKRKKDKQKPLTKVVIRRLPPTMSEETFKEQINPIPDHDYFYFVPADWTLGLNSSCRAYINFLRQEDIFIFKEKFDGYVFVDTRGAEYPAVVEFAPFQGLPKNRARKKDAKCNTIETESHFLAFLETLKGDNEKQESKLEFTYQFRDDKKIKSTPLLEFIATKRQEKREEKKRKVEEKRRAREEEKLKKKNQVAKGIPASIAEQEKEGEDDIIVRTIKSRTVDKRNKKDKEKEKDVKKQEKPPLDEKAKAAKEEKDKKRAERDQQRKLERERRNEERKKEKALLKAQKSANEGASASTEEVRKEVKKYSERRREQRQEKKAEASTSEANNDVAKAVAEKAETKDEEKPVEKSNRQLKREKLREEREKQKEERQARRIRNKDRPSIQIYQPGRSRLSSLSKKNSGDDTDQAQLSQSPTEAPNEAPIEAPTEAPAETPVEAPVDLEIA
ncbi:regulator of nonsense transcripts 3B-like [Phlebotomus argentipes]|uniref:regulator of nonsense transcripts 3B-like n=1 Tax=Phlebotomus argentipes TaxID=94469 RepID=UPI0028935E68|nr:regulator of nonsense transcripts 3B-like [Phlebotomus argentipes]